MDVVLTIAAIVLFVAGFIFIGIEMFAPGFGWPGVGGILCFAAGIFLLADSVIHGIIITVAVAVLCGILFWIIMSLLAKGKLKSPLILNDKVEDNGGYVANKGLSDMLGAVGTAVTELRPTGKAVFNERELDVVSSGKFILKGQKVVVIKAEGYRLVVDELCEKVMEEDLSAVGKAEAVSEKTLEA